MKKIIRSVFIDLPTPSDYDDTKIEPTSRPTRMLFGLNYDFNIKDDQAYGRLYINDKKICMRIFNFNKINNYDMEYVIIKINTEKCIINKFIDNNLEFNISTITNRSTIKDVVNAMTTRQKIMLIDRTSIRSYIFSDYKKSIVTMRT